MSRAETLAEIAALIRSKRNLRERIVHARSASYRECLTDQLKAVTRRIKTKMEEMP